MSAVFLGTKHLKPQIFIPGRRLRVLQVAPRIRQTILSHFCPRKCHSRVRHWQELPLKPEGFLRNIAWLLVGRDTGFDAVVGGGGWRGRRNSLGVGKSALTIQFIQSQFVDE